jgi:caa(3)-type oxidase subunit IV
MTDWHDPVAGESHHPGEQHHGPTLVSYLVVAVALSVFTLVSFVVNGLVPDKISHMTSLWIILGVAVCKASLVAAFFMHLKYDWGKLYFMIVPALILGVMMALVFLPDIVVAWWHNPY